MSKNTAQQGLSNHIVHSKKKKNWLSVTCSKWRETRGAFFYITHIWPFYLNRDEFVPISSSADSSKTHGSENFFLKKKWLSVTCSKWRETQGAFVYQSYDLFTSTEMSLCQLALVLTRPRHTDQNLKNNLKKKLSVTCLKCSKWPCSCGTTKARYRR